MITPTQLKTLQTYATGLDTNVRLSFEDGTGRVLINYGDKRYIGLSNKYSSMLSMKMVKAQIDKCVAKNSTGE